MRTGMWIDMRRAVIIRIHDGHDDVNEIQSNIEEYNVHGGYGGARKNMPQDARSDKKYLARREKQMAQYFSQVMKQLRQPERLFVFGPGETRKLFVRAVRNNPKFSDTRVRQEAADQMPVNQIQAAVRQYFKVDHPNTRKQKNGQPGVSVDIIHEFVRMRPSKASEDLVVERLGALVQRYPRIIRAKAFYKKEKDTNAKNFVCEMELSIPGENIFASARDTDLAPAIAETFRDLERQMRKRRGKERARKSVG